MTDAIDYVAIDCGAQRRGVAAMVQEVPVDGVATGAVGGLAEALGRVGARGVPVSRRVNRTGGGDEAAKPRQPRLSC